MTPVEVFALSIAFFSMFAYLHVKKENKRLSELAAPISPANPPPTPPAIELDQPTAILIANLVDRCNCLRMQIEYAQTWLKQADVQSSKLHRIISELKTKLPTLLNK